MYLLARGVPGLIGFLAVPIFTRLLKSDDYGRYGLVIASVDLLNGLIFQWLRLSLVRYLSAYRDDPRKLKSTLVTSNLLLVALLGLIALFCYFVPLGAWQAEWRPAIFPCWLLTAVQAVFELSSEYARASLRPLQVMVLTVVRSVSLVGLGAVLILLGLGWWGPMIGISIGMLVVVAIYAKPDWGDVRLQLDRQMLAAVARYGLPISVTVALAVVIGSTDRYLLGYLIGVSQTGVYVAVSNLASQSIVIVMLAISSAMFPLAVRAFEHEGPEAARDQMRHNASLLSALGLPCVMGMSVCAPAIAQVLLGPDFRDHWNIIPLIAAGAFLASLKAFHFDTAFQFSHRTIHQVWIVLFVAVVNFILNWIAIPIWGINGAAGASALAYVISIALTIWFGRRHFEVPFPLRPIAQVALACLLMGAAIFPFRHHVGFIPLVGQVGLGIVVYGVVLLACNFLNGRDFLARKWAARRAASVPREPNLSQSVPVMAEQA